jgi:hypothetical protein
MGDGVFVSDKSEWTEHDGGPCPVGEWDLVEVRIAGKQKTYEFHAGIILWENVTHYRVVKP